jgi:probable addiction module antidote protein
VKQFVSLFPANQLYKALSPEGNPEFSTVVKVINALGMRLHAAHT